VTNPNPAPWWVPDLDDEAIQAILKIAAETDAQNTEIGVSGPDVAKYNVRVAKLRLLEKRIDQLTTELKVQAAMHNIDPTTRRIEEWRSSHSGGKNK
jgi:hypothetical protein